MRDLDGICMLNAIVWDHASTDLIIFCNVCLRGLSFYCPYMNAGFCSHIPDLSQTNTIFFLEVICIVLALAWAMSISPLAPRCLLIYMDSMDMVELFHSM